MEKNGKETIKKIKVRVKKNMGEGFFGYYAHTRRREGDVFIINEAHFSKIWMEKVSKDEPINESVIEKGKILKINERNEPLMGSNDEVI